MAEAFASRWGLGTRGDPQSRHHVASNHTADISAAIQGLSAHATLAVGTEVEEGDVSVLGSYPPSSVEMCGRHE